MLVYRVQNENGQGMYHASDYAYTVLSDTYARHPMPYDDLKLMNALSLDGQDYRGKLFAFSSLEQLKFWIYREDDRAAIADDGCKVYTIDAKRVWVGDTQCVFDIEGSEVVNVTELTEV
jgi:hypothetical protein